MRSVNSFHDDQSFSSIRRRHQLDDASDSSSDSDSIYHESNESPDNGSFSISGGFDPARTASRTGNFFERTSRHAPSLGAPVDEPAHPPRTLNGTESRAELMEIIANMQEQMAGMQEQMAGLARQVRDGARGTSASRGRREDPAAQQRRQVRQQERLQAQHARMKEVHFRHEMERLDREETQLNRQREHEDFKLAHELQMQEQKIANMRRKLEMQDAEMAMQTLVKAGEFAVNLTRHV